MGTLRVTNIEAKSDSSSPSVHEKVSIRNSSEQVIFEVDGKNSPGVGTVFVGSGIVTATTLHLEGNDPTITMTDTSGTNDIATIESLSGAIRFTARDGNADGEVIFRKFDGTTHDETLRITNIGRVGVGTNSPSTTVDIQATQAELIVKSTSGTNSAGFRMIPGGATNALYMYADGNRNINFDDHATGRLQIQSDGDLSITDGNLVLANTHGIDFSATAGSGDSELLDDYERGEWTPRLNGWNGSSYVNVTNSTSNEPGHYIKVGRQVTLFIKYEWTSMPVANGNPLYIYDLPFNVTDDHHSAGSLARVVGFTDEYNLCIYKHVGSTNLLYIQKYNETNPTGMNGNAGKFIATLTYMASV